jgi:hypothetical protein
MQSMMTEFLVHERRRELSHLRSRAKSRPRHGRMRDALEFLRGHKEGWMARARLRRADRAVPCCWPSIEAAE